MFFCASRKEKKTNGKIKSLPIEVFVGTIFSESWRGKVHNIFSHVTMYMPRGTTWHSFLASNVPVYGPWKMKKCLVGAKSRILIWKQQQHVCTCSMKSLLISQVVSVESFSTFNEWGPVQLSTFKWPAIILFTANIFYFVVCQTFLSWDSFLVPFKL